MPQTPDVYSLYEVLLIAKERSKYDRTADGRRTLADGRKQMFGFLGRINFTNDICDLAVRFSSEQIFEKLHVKVIERYDAERILIWHAGKPHLRQIVRPVENLFDRIRFGKTIANQG